MPLLNKEKFLYGITMSVYVCPSVKIWASGPILMIIMPV